MKRSGSGSYDSSIFNFQFWQFRRFWQFCMAIGHADTPSPRLSGDVRAHLNVSLTGACSPLRASYRIPALPCRMGLAVSGYNFPKSNRPVPGCWLLSDRRRGRSRRVETWKELTPDRLNHWHSQFLTQAAECQAKYYVCFLRFTNR